MKLFILLITFMFSLSPGNCCQIGYDYYLLLSCQESDTKPDHIIKNGNVGCGTNEVLLEKIGSIHIWKCHFNDFNFFKNFKTLWFDFFNEIKTLRKEAFIGMDQLEQIIVGHSNMEILDSAFSDLPNLQGVSISRNKINYLSDLAFKGAHKLKALTLSSLSMSSLPVGFFRDLNDLEYLSFDDNKFANLSSIDFTGLDNVKWLNLNMNRISNVTANSFGILKNLKYLFLSYNRIDDVESMTFAEMNVLIHLNLEGNQIHKLNKGVFTGLTNLRSLNLLSNQIYFIEDGAFSTMNNLKKLDLKHNRLTALDEHSFKDLGNLQYLRLAKNLISEINVRTFAALTKLEQLDLSDQYKLETIDLNAFPQFIDLKTKTVIHTQISSESDDFEKEELLWIKTFIGEVVYFNDLFFRSFQSNPYSRFWSNLNYQIDWNNLTLNLSNKSIIFGNLNLSKRRLTSIRHRSLTQPN